jgi:hypothetical protein
MQTYVIILYIIASIFFFISPYLLLNKVYNDAKICNCNLNDIKEYTYFKWMIILYYIILIYIFIINLTMPKSYLFLQLNDAAFLIYTLYMLYYCDNYLLKKIYEKCNCNKSYLLMLLIYTFLILNILKIFI